MNPLTQQEKSEIKNWANTQFIISRRYADPVRSSFYLGRSVAAGKLASQYNPLKLKNKHTASVVCLFLFAAALTLPVFRSGLRTNLTFVEWILNHTIWGPKIEYIPKEDYMSELMD